MAVVCPYCAKSMQLKGVKPGRYTPKCPKCGKAFLLTVAADPEAPLQVAPLDKAPAKPALEKAAPKPTPPPPKPPEVERTGAWDAADAGHTTDFSAPPDAPKPPPQDAGATTDFGSAPAASPDETVDPTEAQPVSQAPAKAPKAKEKPRAKEKAKAKPSAAEEDDVPVTLGGYRIEKLLGQGGMGAVYLARQLSLDRAVALKTMRPEWTAHAAFVARFTREAYAAAQLVHHNIVQIYDIGSDAGTNFFSMEFVRGQSLGELLKKDGKLDAEAAVGYVLQAARGLKFCHDQGMIHRDIKPDNLMLNDQGIVKVADLGLVKTPAAAEEEEKEEERGDTPPSIAEVARADITRVGSGMGTAAYMAPEQARDAHGVDGRADMYSLGCTLYALLTGRPPFQGQSALEVITKHLTEPVEPPDAVVKRVPADLSAIVLKMMAKDADARYADLGEVVAALEGWLGVQSSGPFTPREEHADALEKQVQTFHAGRPRGKTTIALGFVGLCALLVVVFALMKMPLVAGGFLGLPLLTGIAYVVLSGFLGKTFLFRKLRAFVLDSGWRDWLWWTVGVLLFFVILYLFNLLFVWLGFVVVAALLAGAVWFLIDRPAAGRQEAPVREAEGLLRTMRLRGLGEEELRQFVCKYGGDNWEGFYEALFGFEAKLEAREKWGRGERDRKRPRHAAWREPVVAWIDAKLKARRETRERRHLEAVEAKRLQAKGATANEAKRQAEESAAALLEQVAELKREVEQAKREPRRTAPPPPPRRSRDLARTPRRAVSDKPYRAPRGAGIFNLILGPKPRFLVGALLLIAFGLWLKQNNLVPGRAVVENMKDLSWLEKLSKASGEPLKFPLLPEALGPLFNGFGPGVAGLILVLSALARGVRVSLFALPAAALALLGPKLPLPEIGPLTPQTVSLAGAAVLAVVGFVLLGRRR